MEALSLIENILWYNVLQGHVSWLTLVKNPAASSSFPGESSVPVGGLAISHRFLSSAGLCSVEEPSCHMAY